MNCDANYNSNKCASFLYCIPLMFVLFCVMLYTVRNKKNVTIFIEYAAHIVH